MTTRNTRALRSLSHLFSFLVALAFLCLGAPAFAQEEPGEGTEGSEETPAPEQQENLCSEAVKQCDTQSVTDAYTVMRTACSDLRKCQSECRAEKIDCKTAAREEKRDCKKECSNLKGKAERECKSTCADAKRKAKQLCRSGKRDCKNACAREAKTSECVQARNKFWGSFIGSAKNCAADTSSQCKDVFPKK